MPASTSSAGAVHVDVADGVATVEFSHPRGNSLPGPLLRRLSDGITSIGSRPDAHVIVLRSGGGPFCAGASFDELKAIRDAREGQDFFAGFARLILAMIRSPKLIVTRVHGKVVGGGVGLVAASDYAMAASAASLRLSELAVGIGPFVVGPVIERRIGQAAFGAMAMDADWRTAQWGEAAGLYARVLDDLQSLDAAVDAFARQLARSNPEALAQLKQIFWQGTESWDRLLEERAAMSGALVLSPFTRDAIAAFERR